MNARPVIDRPVPRLAMSLEDLALSIGVSPNSVLKMVEEGCLPPPRLWHRRKVWRVAEIDAALAEWPTAGGAPARQDDLDLEEWRAEA